MDPEKTTNDGNNSPNTGTAPGQQSGNPGEQQSPANQTPTQNPGQGDGQQTEPTTTMPTKDFNDRITQAKRSGVRDLLLALGFTNVDTPEAVTQIQQDLQTTITYAKTQREADMTAEQRLQSQLDSLNAQLETANSQVKTATEQATQAQVDLVTYKRNIELRQAASTAGARYPEDVLSWAAANAADRLPTMLNEDGSVNADAIRAIITDCGKARPEWFRGVQPGSPSNADGRPPTTFQNIKDRAALAARNVREAI